MCFELLYKFFLKHLILRRNENDVIIDILKSPCTVPLFFSDLRNLNFLSRFSKEVKMSNLMKVRPLGAELFHAEGQIDKRT